MKKTPYNEIIDVVKEQKEYSLLCQAKSKKYVRYTDWENHIEMCLYEFPTPQDLYNFKRYCKNRERTSARAPETLAVYIALLIPFLIDVFEKDIPGWLMLIWFLVVAGYSIWKNNVIIKESYFYTDVIEIIEKVEDTRNTSK